MVFLSSEKLAPRRLAGTERNRRNAPGTTSEEGRRLPAEVRKGFCTGIPKKGLREEPGTFQDRLT
jgi:hypothetical protein